MEYYTWILTFHVVSFMSWMAMLFYLPRLFVYHVENIEKKLDKVLNLLSNPISTPSIAPQVSSLSAEDQREIEEVRRLASGGSSSNEWDD